MVGTLFDEPGGFDRDRFAATLGRLAAERIYIGTSSWKYEGWIGQIYSRAHYLSRGRFSRKRFEAECLREYAQVFPIVCGDFAFYQFPAPEYWRRLFQQVPPEFRFAFKVPEPVTGSDNPTFLDAEVLRTLFLRPLWPHHEQTALLIFEFTALPPEPRKTFLEKLNPFLEALPPQYRYAEEIRNPDLLTPDYFRCLRNHGVAHVYNAWSRMPELGEQIAIPESATADFAVCRALLRRGRDYQAAVNRFSPYTEIRDPNPEARQAMRMLIGRARDKREMAFLFVNNRLEGNAPLTILSMVEP